jgi:hypothetical protein
VQRVRLHLERTEPAHNLQLPGEGRFRVLQTQEATNSFFSSAGDMPRGMTGRRVGAAAALAAALTLALVVMHTVVLGPASAPLLLAAPATGGSALEQHVARLEAESKELEQVRLRAVWLNNKIAGLERRAQPGSVKESAALSAEATKLKAHLLDLAKAAHLEPLVDAGPAKRPAKRAVPARHHYIDDDARGLPSQAYSQHHYIDDDSVGRTVYGTHHYIDDDSREVPQRTQVHGSGIDVGVLGRTKHDGEELVVDSRGRHHYVDDDSWKIAPKQDQWGEEQLGKAGAKQKADDFYNYGNPTKVRPWQYGPKESAFGADFVPGVKGQKDISFGNSWKKMGKDDSWKIAPSGDSLLNKVKDASTGGSAAAKATAAAEGVPGGSKAWAKAEEWFKNMKRTTAKEAKEQREQREQQQQVKAAVEARVEEVSHLDESVSSRVASDLKVLHEARAAEAALRKANVLPSRAPAQARAAEPAQRAAPAAAPVEAAVSADVALEDGARTDARAAKGGDADRYGALERTEGMLNNLIASDDSKFGGDTAVESAAQREQAGWQAAAEDAAADKPLDADGSMPAEMTESNEEKKWNEAEKALPTSAPAAKAQAVAQASVPAPKDGAGLQSMSGQLQRARAEMRELPPVDRAAAKAAIAAMDLALKGARVSQAAVLRNVHTEHAMGKAAKVAAKQMSSLEEDPTVRQAEEAQQEVLRLEQQIQAAKSGSVSRAGLYLGRGSNVHEQIHQQVMAEAARAAARGSAAKATGPLKAAKATGPHFLGGGGALRPGVSRLANLGINTGEGVWGDDVASPVDNTYRTGGV